MQNGILGPVVTATPDVPLTARQQAELDILSRQKRVTSFPYHSTVKFEFVQSGAGPYVYTLAQGTEIRAFSYGKRQQMQSAGFAVADGLATSAETNLSEQNQTIGGENVEIWGIALMPLHGGIHPTTEQDETYSAGEYFSDFRALAQLGTNVSVKLGLNGDQNLHDLGVMEMLPGAGGFTGVGLDQLVMISLDGNHFPFPFGNSGWATRSNFFRLPEGLVWRSKGKADGMLNIVFRVERTIRLHSGGDPDNQFADEAAAAGIRGYNFPTKIMCVLKAHLIGKVVGPRSHVA